MQAQSLRQLVSTDRNKVSNYQLIPTDSKKYDNDHLFEQLGDLVNEQYRAWYCKMFYTIGKDRVLVLASIARQDSKSNPRGYFSKLLKGEVSK